MNKRKQIESIQRSRLLKVLVSLFTQFLDNSILFSLPVARTKQPVNPVFAAPVVAQDGFYTPYLSYPAYPTMSSCTTMPYLLQPYQASLMATTPQFTNVYPMNIPQNQAVYSYLPGQAPLYPVTMNENRMQMNTKPIHSDCIELFSVVSSTSAVNCSFTYHPDSGRSFQKGNDIYAEKG